MVSTLGKFWKFFNILEIQFHMQLPWKLMFLSSQQWGLLRTFLHCINSLVLHLCKLQKHSWWWCCHVWINWLRWTIGKLVNNFRSFHWIHNCRDYNLNEEVSILVHMQTPQQVYLALFGVPWLIFSLQFMIRNLKVFRFSGISVWTFWKVIKVLFLNL